MKDSEKDSRITITGTQTSLKLDYGDPPDLFVDEYIKVDEAFGELEDTDGLGTGWGRATTIKEVKRDVKKLWQIHKDITKNLSEVSKAIAGLENAAEQWDKDRK